MNIGVLGGTFDPVHLGHLIVGEEARVRLGLDQVIFIPAGPPWLKAGQCITPAQHRLRMVELAVASNPYFRVVANEVQREGPTYTVDTLQELRRQLGKEPTLHFIVGMDSLEQFHLWKDPERLLELCRLVVVNRPGHQAVDVNTLVGRFPQAGESLRLLTVPRIEISATEVRKRVAEGISIRYLVPQAVEEYILEQGLYRNHEGGQGNQ
jgi:nicotinate-nucleotide adenylyltransferase